MPRDPRQIATRCERPGAKPRETGALPQDGTSRVCYSARSSDERNPNVRHGGILDDTSGIRLDTGTLRTGCSPDFEPADRRTGSRDASTRVGAGIAAPFAAAWPVRPAASHCSRTVLAATNPPGFRDLRNLLAARLCAGRTTWNSEPSDFLDAVRCPQRFRGIWRFTTASYAGTIRDTPSSGQLPVPDFLPGSGTQARLGFVEHAAGKFVCRARRFHKLV